jgi:hypothetical protein
VAVRSAAAASAALLLLACASGPGPLHPELARVWREFLALPEERALVVAGDPRRDRWVSGASGGHASPEEAEGEAFLECQRRRAERRLQEPCQLYAVGEEVVWAGPE